MEILCKDEKVPSVTARGSEHDIKLRLPMKQLECSDGVSAGTEGLSIMGVEIHSSPACFALGIRRIETDSDPDFSATADRIERPTGAPVSPGALRFREAHAVVFTAIYEQEIRGRIAVQHMMTKRQKLIAGPNAIRFVI